jgi:hypothetical protein
VQALPVVNSIIKTINRKSNGKSRGQKAWCGTWEPKGLRSLRFLTTAFNDGPVKRDARKTRDLILSEWYQSLWPEVQLTRTAEMSFSNSDTGTREGVAFGSLTSQRGDRLVVDDPHSVDTAESETEHNNIPGGSGRVPSTV